MEAWLKVFTLFNILTVSVLGGDNVEEEFKATDRGYYFRCRFTTSLCADEVLDILYNFDHVRQYTFSSEDVALVSSKESEYLVRVRFSRFFYSFNSLFRRTLQGDTVFTYMEEFSQKRAFIPDVSRSKGVYQVIRNDRNTEVELVQEVRFAGSVNRIYMRMIQSGVNKFRDSILDYIKQKESKSQ